MREVCRGSQKTPSPCRGTIPPVRPGPAPTGSCTGRHFDCLLAPATAPVRVDCWQGRGWNMRTTTWLSALLLALSTLWAGPGWGGEPVSTPGHPTGGDDPLPSASDADGLLTAEDAGTWLDGLVPYMLKRND